METAGIKIECNAKGIPTFAHIDLRRYGEELKDFFISKGFSVEHSIYNSDFVKMIKSQENMPETKKITFKAIALDTRNFKFNREEAARKYNYSFYDSLIIAAAIESGCSILYSEDMQHNQLIEEKLKIVNPFL